jgi:hypothetical protein
MNVINKFKALRKAINELKANMEFKARDILGSNALWNYMVVNASLRSYIICHDQSGLSRLSTPAENLTSLSKFFLFS